MKCSQCGTEVGDNARFCPRCGSEIKRSPAETDPAGKDDAKQTDQLSDEVTHAGESDVKAPQEGHDTDASPAASEVDPSPATPGTGDSDTTVAGAETSDSNTKSVDDTDAKKHDGASKSSVGQTLKTLTKTKKARIAIIGVAVLVVIIVIVAIVVGTSGPSDSELREVIENETDSLGWPSAGDYGSDAAYEISSIDIVSKEQEDVEEDLSAALGIDDYYMVNAEVEGSNGAADVELSVSFDYVLWNDSWVAMNASSDIVSATATQGIDEDKLVENASDILSAADDSRALVQQYEDADISVGGVNFDEEAQTCSADITFSSASAYASSQATISTSFSFQDGTWTLVDTTADADAGSISYDELVGTWTGVFYDQSTYNEECYGAEGNDLTLTITSVDSESGKVEGTYTALAHNHAPTDSAQSSTDGDAMTSEISFVGTIETDKRVSCDDIVISTDNRCDILCESVATNPDDQDCALTLTLAFGTTDDDAAAYAILRTEYTYPYSVVPGTSYDRTASYYDAYKLTKSE